MEERSPHIPGEGVELPSGVSGYPDQRIEHAIEQSINRGEWSGPRPNPMELYVQVETLRAILLDNVGKITDKLEQMNDDDWERATLYRMMITEREDMLKWLEHYPDDRVYMAWFLSPVEEEIEDD